MTTSREFRESPLSQGVGESVSYQLTTTPWGGSPSAVTVTVFDVTNYGRVDVTATVMPTNTPSVNGDVITLSPLRSLTDGRSYRLEVAFTSDGNDYEAFGFVEAEQ